MPSAPTRYTDPRAHELRERYLATYGGAEIPVPVESIAEDLLGLRIEEDDVGCSGMLIPAQRLILVDACETDSRSFAAGGTSRSPDSCAVSSRFDVSALAAQRRVSSCGLVEKPRELGT